MIHLFRALIIVLTSMAISLGYCVGKAQADSSSVILPVETVTALLSEAQAISKLPRPPEKIPTVVIMDHASLVKMACENHPSCTIVAFYLDDYNLIVMDANFVDPTTLIGRSVIIHELTHYLRQTPPEKYQTVDGCDAEEGAAYDAQRAYILKYKGDPSFLLQPGQIFLNCFVRFHK